MDLVSAGLDKRAFRLHGKPLTVVRYQTQAATLEFLRDMYAHDRGVGVLYGPALSGKTTVLKQFVDELPQSAAVAVIDCGRLNTSTFLASILAQFGFQPKAPTVNEQLNLLKTFLVQRTCTDRAPLLVVENANKIDLMIYRCLGELIQAQYYGRPAVRVLLVSNRSLRTMINASVHLKGLRINECLLEPMTRSDTGDYVKAKLGAAGCDDPERFVPRRLMDDIFKESEGYPGLVDWSILRRLQEADELPLGQKYHVRFFAGARRAISRTAARAYLPIPTISPHSHINASSIRSDAE